ncbi:MAG: ABC transporter ATP-binding protein [Clostridiales bacterium]|nr:ABC transporter ATP-binding protein [Clostridiales bacterium]
MLKVNHLSKSYKTGSRTYPVLKDISLEVNRGEFVAVMGPSGSGKTTLLNCVSCFVPRDQGEILLAGQDISKANEKEMSKIRNQRIGFVFQDFMLLDGLSVFENICLPQIIAGKPIAQMEAKAGNICASFGIDSIKNKYPAEISGGEKQRTAVARALMNQPFIIMADEPTGNLDSKSCRAVIEAFVQAKKEMGATVLMVTHDSFAASFCDRVIMLKDGMVYNELRRDGSRREFMDRLLYTIGRLGGDCDDDE